jgi:pentatricopeptide repeat protein
MEMERLCPNEVTFTCTLKACGSIGAISKGQQIHAKVVGKGLLGKDLALDDALVGMYVMCGCLLEATELFDALSVRDAVLWSALIVGYARQGLVEEALNLSEGMKHEGLSPNSVTYACILKACASAGLVGKGEEISDEIVETGLHRKDIVLGTAMVDMYAKCGMPERASTVLDELPLRDVFSWSALLAGYAQHGMYDAALVCLEEMRYEGLPANNPIVFLGVLNALCHSGLMYEAQMLFVNMERECCITPELEHYICIIDSLGRAGQTERAIAVIQEMPFSEYLPVWASLLGACHKWGDVNLGRLAFDSILQLDVHNDAAYISMAGIYRAANMQGHAKVIEGMRAEVFKNTMYIR